eukprot:scaffold58258_cov62-Phaeocystis_antarctica.AAC.1
MVTPGGNDAALPPVVGVCEGAFPDRQERGRIPEVQARDFSAPEGVLPDRLDVGTDHERARDVGVGEGEVLDRRARV